MIKIALYKPDIAENVGAIIRTCVCFDLELIVIMPCGFPFDINRIKKSAMDYINYAKITKYGGFEDFYDKEIKETKSRLILASTKASTNYKDFAFKDNDVVMFGRESSGVPHEVFALSDERVLIEMKNNMRSLNVAISCGIIASFACNSL
ncbi:MAG: tRNA methyltransferase [Rickettsiales bacterium]|nr:tRNA methyltransferase [Rickettsiales bacterium]